MRTKSKTTDENRSEQQAQSQFESIKEMVDNMKAAQTDEQRERAEQTIQEDALNVEVRSGWYVPGANDNKPEEYNILLCTGGPAVRIIGELGEYGEPETAHLEHQDWGTYWQELQQSGEDQDVLLEYARKFYFAV